MSLFVVYVPITGHVVGAVHAIGAVPPDDAASLVGRALEMRVAISLGEIEKIPLLARDLAAHTADDDPRVLDDPLAYGVEQVPNGDPKPALVRLASEPVELAFTMDSLVVTVSPVSVRTKVLTLISDGEDPIVGLAEIAVGGDSVEFPVTVANGETRGVLALVSGWTGVLEAVTRS